MPQRLCILRRECCFQHSSRRRQRLIPHTGTQHALPPDFLGIIALERQRTGQRIDQRFSGDITKILVGQRIQQRTHVRFIKAGVRQKCFDLSMVAERFFHMPVALWEGSDSLGAKLFAARKGLRMGLHDLFRENGGLDAGSLRRSLMEAVETTHSYLPLY